LNYQRTPSIKLPIDAKRTAECYRRRPEMSAGIRENANNFPPSGKSMVGRKFGRASAIRFKEAPTITKPHSGQRSGVARRSYPHCGQ
jgi:hypothetical protein